MGIDEMEDFVRKNLHPKNLGVVLKTARKKKGYSLDEAEEETKVRVKYLEALEESKFEVLPGNVYALGFLAKYADYLGLDKEPLMAQFKLERGGGENLSRLMPESKIKEPVFSVTPKILIIFAVILVLAGILGYIIISVRQFTLPPNLEISSPSSEQILKEDKVEIVGKTDEGATLMINNQSVLIDGNGNFTQQVKLNPGLNIFEVKSTNRLKKETVKQVKVLAEF